MVKLILNSCLIFRSRHTGADSEPETSRSGGTEIFGASCSHRITRTGVLTDHQPQWIHASRLKHLSTYALPIDTVGPKKPAQSV